MSDATFAIEAATLRRMLADRDRALDEQRETIKAYREGRYMSDRVIELEKDNADLKDALATANRLHAEAIDELTKLKAELDFPTLEMVPVERYFTPSGLEDYRPDGED